ncbi:MAG TPA: hypothetical protein VM223_26575 [Planctomycetota bacterium]|nr:hypothetical protein [Planctomycetota bacterium]
MDDLARNILKGVWEDRVRAKPIYHGMSSANLTDPLDPAKDPFAAMRPKLYRLLDALQRLTDSGFQFVVREEHFGVKYANDLRLIVAWTRNDLDNPGIDFTTSYYDACGYADCCQGSQLKENFRYITSHVPERKDDPVVRRLMGAEEWALVGDVADWIAQGAAEHRSIVLHVDRSCPAFDPDARCQPVGSLEGFSQKVLDALGKKGLPCTVETVNLILPREEEGFTVRMYRALTKEHIMKIDEVTTGKVARATGPRGVG